MSVPFTFHVVPKKVKDYTFGNKLVSLTCYMNLKDKIDDAIKDATDMSKKFKSSYIPVGGYTAV